MIVVLNGPLGIGKSTLAEALMEAMDSCVMLDGDHVIAMNPPPANELEHLHSTLRLLVRHHRALGYRHFVINHIWRTAESIDGLRRRLGDMEPDIRCFLLTLPLEANHRRIRSRQATRVVDEQAFEAATVAEERDALYGPERGELGEEFDVSGPPDALVVALLARLGPI
jgi:thymidylate kinase